MASGLEAERNLDCIAVLEIYLVKAVLLGVLPAFGGFTDIDGRTRDG